MPRALSGSGARGSSWGILSLPLLGSMPEPAGYPPDFCDLEAIRRPSEIDALKK